MVKRRRRDRLRSLYDRFARAATRGNADEIARLVRQHPRLHQYVGHAGNLIDTIRWLAPKRRALALLRAAFQAGLSPDAGQRNVGQTFLQAAAANGHVGQLRLAIRFAADLEKRNQSGETALGYACSWRQFNAVKLLVGSGAQVNAIEKDPEGIHSNTALDCCHDPRIAKYLRRKGAKKLAELRTRTRNRGRST